MLTHDHTRRSRLHHYACLLFSALFLVLSCVSLPTDAAAAQSKKKTQHFKVLDGFVVGKTPVIPYIKKKLDRCRLFEQTKFFVLTGDACYDIEGLHHAVISRKGDTVFLYYERDLIPLLMRHLTKRYGRAQRTGTQYLWDTAAGRILVETEEQYYDDVAGLFVLAYHSR